ncbi:MAG: hypothetical protein ACRDJM_11465, partial [Actinomycetota bacterium]
LWTASASERLAFLRREARTVNPQFEIFANGARPDAVDYVMNEGALVPELDWYRAQHRRDVTTYPGVVPGPDPVVVSNAFGYKYFHSTRQPDGFAYNIPYLQIPDGNHQNVDSALLNMAEAATFGGGAGCDAAYLDYFYWIYTPDQARELRATAKRFRAFVRAHARLYAGQVAAADVGIAFHDLPFWEGSYGRDEFLRITDLAKALAGRGVLWDVLTANRVEDGTLSRLRVLVVQDVARISIAEAEAVRRFLERGGLVLAAGIVADLDEWFRMRLPDPSLPWPPVGRPPRPVGFDARRDRPPPMDVAVGLGRLVYRPEPFDADTVITIAEAHLGRTIRLVEGVSAAALDRLRINAWFDPDRNDLAVHLLNYDVLLGIPNGGRVRTLENVRVRVPLPAGMLAPVVTLHTPEASEPCLSFAMPFTDAFATFTIPRLHIYSVAHIADVASAAVTALDGALGGHVCTLGDTTS